MDENIKAALRAKMTKIDRFDDCLYQFLLLFWSSGIKEKFVYNWHIEYICKELQVWCKTLISRTQKECDFIINIPPGETKSFICSVIFPAWLWTIDPTIRIMSISYTERLAVDLSVKSKDIISSSDYQALFGRKFSMRSDMDSKAHFQNDKGGYRLATSVGALATGFHVHLKIFDDPNNPFEAFNPDIYDKDNLWYDTVAKNRNVDEKITLELFIQQRTGINDMTAHLLSKKNRKFTHIKAPASIDYDINPPELIKYYKDGVMNPSRKPLEVLQSIKDDMDDFSYDSQYGQDPIKKTGGMVSKDDFPIIENLPSDFWAGDVYYFVDGNFKKGMETDPIGISVVVPYRYDIFIVEFVKERLRYTEQKELIISMIKRYSGLNSKSIVVIEEASNGYAIIDEFQRDLPINVIPYPKSNDTKFARFSTCVSYIRGGRVKLLSDEFASKRWIKSYLETVTKFPNVKHDEEIDCTIMPIDILVKDQAIEDDNEFDVRQFVYINF